METNLPTPVWPRNTRPKETDSSSRRRGCCSGNSNHGRPVTQKMIMKLWGSQQFHSFKSNFWIYLGLWMHDREIMNIDQGCRPLDQGCRPFNTFWSWVVPIAVLFQRSRVGDNHMYLLGFLTTYDGPPAVPLPHGSLRCPSYWAKPNCGRTSPSRGSSVVMVPGVALNGLYIAPWEGFEGRWSWNTKVF